MDYSELKKLQEELDQKEERGKTAQQTAKNPAIPKSGKEEVRKDGKAEIPLSRNQEIPKTRYQENLNTRKEEIRKGGNQDIPISGKPDTPKSGNPTALKVPKYYTQLPLALQDEIKVYAIRSKLKDYEVVIQAIEEFFKKRK